MIYPNTVRDLGDSPAGHVKIRVNIAEADFTINCLLPANILERDEEHMRPILSYIVANSGHNKENS